MSAWSRASRWKRFCLVFWWSASAFSAAFAGVLVNITAPDYVGSSRLLLFVFAGITALGVFIARGAARGIKKRSSIDVSDASQAAGS